MNWESIDPNEYLKGLPDMFILFLLLREIQLLKIDTMACYLLIGYVLFNLSLLILIKVHLDTLFAKG
jgi:hypothetical protein